MKWRIEDGPEVESDLELIYDHLVAVHHSLGRSLDEAVLLAERRVVRIHEQRLRLAVAPGMGARHDDLLPGLRHVTIDRAIY